LTIGSLDEKSDVLALNPATTAMKKGFNASTMILQANLGLTACQNNLGVPLQIIKPIQQNQWLPAPLDH
jgi:hypothetical protein